MPGTSGFPRWPIRLGSRIVVPAFVAAFLLSGAAAAYPGGDADAYLRAPVGATAQAMGGAGAALPATCLSLWNPAALAALPLSTKQFSIGTGLRSMGRLDGNAALEFRIPTRIGVGIAALYRGDPVVDIYDIDEVNLGRASYSTITSKLAVSYLFSRALSMGVGVGVFYQNLPAFGYDGIENAWSFSIGGIDAGAQYRLRDTWTMALVVQNLNIVTDWQFAAFFGSANQMSAATLPASITLASNFQGALLGAPLVWACDVRGYVIDGTLKPLDHASAVIDNGFEWRRWSSFYLRCGLSDLTLDGELLRDAPSYFDHFWIGIDAGFMADLSRIARGLRLNYGISLGKAWSGVDQQIDVQYSF